MSFTRIVRRPLRQTSKPAVSRPALSSAAPKTARPILHLKPVS
ncbi:hypothetical protein [Phenylobacterium deserti]|nr:hypothetical protein [Phenylobacterium deserti]